jgi:hypothetical protein
VIGLLKIVPPVVVEALLDTLGLFFHLPSTLDLQPGQG